MFKRVLLALVILGALGAAAVFVTVGPQEAKADCGSSGC